MKELFWEVFSITTIVGIIVYLIRQFIWKCFENIIRRKPKPVITFKNGGKEEQFEVNIDTDIESEVCRQMDVERDSLPKAHIQNPYDNPWALIQESPENYNVYNSQRDLYLASKEKQIRDTVTEKYERKVFVPINLVVSNNGKVPMGKCDIEISFSEGAEVYHESAFKECTGAIFRKPVLARGHSFPCLNMGTEEYHFNKLDPQEKLDAPLRYKLDALNQHITNEDVIPLFYVDARKIERLNVVWRIIEPSYREPIIGELVLNINRIQK